MYHKFLCCWPKAPHCLQPFSTTLFVQRPQLAPGQLSSPQTKHARGHHLRFLNRGKFCGQCPHFASTYPPTPSPSPTWRLWPQGAWALALAGKVELRSFKFSPGQTVSKYSNYTLNIFGWKTSILEWKQCRPISRSTVSRFWNVFSLLFFPNAPSSQAAPVLLVADALLTLLTVQVEKSTTMPSIGINFPLCGHFTLCTYYFPDSAPLQHRFPVLHAAGRK